MLCVVHWLEDFIYSLGGDVLGRICSLYPQRHVFTQGPQRTRAGRAKGEEVWNKYWKKLQDSNDAGITSMFSMRGLLELAPACQVFSVSLKSRGRRPGVGLGRPRELCNWWERQNCFPAIHHFPNVIRKLFFSLLRFAFLALSATPLWRNNLTTFPFFYSSLYKILHELLHVAVYFSCCSHSLMPNFCV